MRELDALKEELAYLRLWLGMLAVAEISLIGWLASTLETATSRLLYVALAAMMALAAGIFLIDRRIERRIVRIRTL
jgi:hypothetical protein